MKHLLILAAVAALAACAGAPVTQTTETFCASLPMARAAEDIALAAATNPATPEELAAIKLARATADARCAQAASAPK